MSIATKMWSQLKHFKKQTERRPCEILENMYKMLQIEKAISCGVRNLKNLRISLKYHCTNANN